MTETPAIIITYPFCLGAHNGGARMTREIALQFGQRGIPVWLITVSIKHDPLQTGKRKTADPAWLAYDLDEPFAAANVRIVRVPPNPHHPYLDGRLVLQAVKKITAEQPVTAVLSYFHEAVFLPRFLANQKIPFIILAIWQSYKEATKLPSRMKHPLKFLAAVAKVKIQKSTHQRADHLFAISNHTGRQLQTYLGVDGRKISTAYLGVSDKFLTLQRQKPDKIRRLFYFGRIVPQKGVADAIEALKQLKARGYHDWEFYLNGNGYHDWAANLISQAGLQQQVFLEKPTNDTDLLRELGQSDLVFLPSHDESFGLSFAEAQAAALPVIGYAAGSVPEIVAHDQTGWLAPTGDTEQLTNYLIQAIENPELANTLGLAGRSRAQRLFIWEKTADTILTGLEKFRNQPEMSDGQPGRNGEIE